jgi:hypothetical protein
MKRNYLLFLEDIIAAMDAIERFVEGMSLEDLRRAVDAGRTQKGEKEMKQKVFTTRGSATELSYFRSRSHSRAQALPV